MTPEFARFCRREAIDGARLKDAAERAASGLVDADLGGGLIKQRVARPGQGRGGGYRMLLASKAGARTIFLHGFAKSERANIGPRELAFWRKVSAALLALSDTQAMDMQSHGDLIEVKDHE